MNPMKFLEAIKVVERVNFPPELKDVTAEDYQSMATMIATAQFIAHDVLDKPQPENLVQFPVQQPDYYSGYDQDRAA
jgi:hypothetical protein